MSTISHQTIRLSAGNHRYPEEGACVIELASMLAGEPFSDRPRSVCPVISTFLRGYNDWLGDARRQELYPYASLVVGTRASRQVQRARAAHLARWSLEMRRRRWSAHLPSPIASLLTRLSRPPAGLDNLAHHALRSTRHVTAETHAAALGLLDELVEIGAPQQTVLRGQEGGPGSPNISTTDITKSTPATPTRP